MLVTVVIKLVLVNAEGQSVVLYVSLMLVKADVQENAMVIAPEYAPDLVVIIVYLNAKPPVMDAQHNAAEDASKLAQQAVDHAMVVARNPADHLAVTAQVLVMPHAVKLVRQLAGQAAQTNALADADLAAVGAKDAEELAGVSVEMLAQLTVQRHAVLVAILLAQAAAPNALTLV